MHGVGCLFTGIPVLTIMSTQSRNYLPAVLESLPESQAIKEASLLVMQDTFLVATSLAVILSIMAPLLKKKRGIE